MPTEQINPLADLVRQHCERTGDTIQAIADRGGLSRQTVSNMLNRVGGRQLPRPATLEALAVGLGMSLETVQAAAIETVLGEAGVSRERWENLLLDHARGLDPADIDVLLATARALRNAQHERRNGAPV